MYRYKTPVVPAAAALALSAAVMAAPAFGAIAVTKAAVEDGALSVEGTSRGDRVTLDFTGTEAQVPGAKNVPTVSLLATVYYVLKAVIDPDILRRVFHSKQTPPSGFNRGHYQNPEVDRLLDLASAALGLYFGLAGRRTATQTA